MLKSRIYCSKENQAKKPISCIVFLFVFNVLLFGFVDLSKADTELRLSNLVTDKMVAYYIDDVSGIQYETSIKGMRIADLKMFQRITILGNIELSESVIRRTLLVNGIVWLDQISSKTDKLEKEAQLLAFQNKRGIWTSGYIDMYCSEFNKKKLTNFINSVSAVVKINAKIRGNKNLTKNKNVSMVKNLREENILLKKQLKIKELEAQNVRDSIVNSRKNFYDVFVGSPESWLGTLTEIQILRITLLLTLLKAIVKGLERTINGCKVFWRFLKSREDRYTKDTRYSIKY
ncbi:hypothetical protein [Pedobacter mendelii]|uniref:TNase-like domain-containing protein n=1 Tax=Pedobacter mendelii TaxID=1908240 RepID=A0ABQ2BNH0_9SPHI|nr:hypothetical protein [Pedobacter mendelii]GGI28387.1 hypothetical protein GCM10008119_32390 [Pedobacter mendelii]